MDLREQSIVGCFPEFVLQFFLAQMLVVLRKQFINNIVFPTWASAAGFNNNNNNTNSPPTPNLTSHHLATRLQAFKRLRHGTISYAYTTYSATKLCYLFAEYIK